MSELFRTHLIELKPKFSNVALVAILACLLALTGCGGGGGGGSSSPPPSPPPVDFSDYYPLTKGTSLDYDVTPAGGGVAATVSQTWTSGLTYNGQTTVRTCESPLEWEDEAYVNGQNITYAFSDDTGTIGTLDVPIIYGIDNWQVGQTVASSATVSYGASSYPFKAEVTYIGIESITVAAGTFSDSIKVNFSLNDGALTGTSWFAKDVGLVKETHSDGELWELTTNNTLPSIAPSLLNVSPQAGATDGGNLVTLTGTNFQYGANITIGNKLGSSVLVNNTDSATTFIPAGSLGTTDIAIVNPDCQVAIIEDQFEYRNVWTATSTTGAPETRTGHTAVWTGTEMIVWGGNNGNAIAKNTGGRFDPVSNTWQTVSTVGAPQARWGHTAVWTGTEMIIWGGHSGAFDFITLNTGARYNPQTDSWTPISSVDAPTARMSFPPLWTGTEMIVWGGYVFTPDTGTDTGARYNPVTDTWVPIQTVNAPSSRGSHSSVWTGSEMIVWGGNHNNSYTDTGGIYNPVTDTWAATTLTNAPVARADHVAVWTGSGMLIFGGRISTSTASSDNTGALYDTALDSWQPINTNGAPIFNSPPYNNSIWSDTELIFCLARYNPSFDSWSALWTTGMVCGETAVWTGSRMVQWGGEVNPFITEPGKGGIYDPSVDPNLFPEPLPTISNVNPDNGPVAGGTDITITGSYFRPDARVTIGGNPAVNVTVVDTNTILVTAPAGNPGYANIVVDLPDIPWWKVTATSAYAYTPFSFEGWIGGGINGWQIGSAPGYGSTDAAFSHPSGVFVDATGNIFVGDNFNNRVQKWNSNGDYIGWIGDGSNGWQTGTAPSAGTGNGQFWGVHKLHVDGSGNIYAVDPGNNRIQKWDSTGNMLGWIGGGVDSWQTGTAPAVGSGDRQFNQPMGVALDGSGNIYIADKENHRIQKWEGNGAYVGWIGGGVDGWQIGTAPAWGTGNGSFKWPMDVAVDATGHIYVADTWNWRIQKFDSSGSFIGWIGGGNNGWQTGTAPASGGTGFGEFQEVFGVTLDVSGNIYAANNGSHSVYKWNASGNAIGWIGNGEYGWQTGSVTGTYGTALGSFEFPWDMMVGPDGKLYIADTYNGRIQKWKD